MNTHLNQIQEWYVHCIVDPSFFILFHHIIAQV
jgi:hypothetical protein